jgi:hypothetical protein
MRGQIRKRFWSEEPEYSSSAWASSRNLLLSVAKKMQLDLTAGNRYAFGGHYGLQNL